MPALLARSIPGVQLWESRWLSYSFSFFSQEFSHLDDLSSSHQVIILVYALVGKYNHACAESLRLSKCEGSVLCILKESHPIADHNRMDHEPVLINEIVFHERANHMASSTH